MSDDSISEAEYEFYYSLENDGEITTTEVASIRCPCALTSLKENLGGVKNMDMVNQAVEDANVLVSKCFTEYKEAVPEYEISNAFAMLPLLLAKIDQQTAGIHDLIKNCNSLRSRAWKAEARIKELEGMLDARSREIVRRIQECQACQLDRLQTEGKIEPDAKSRCWQITEEHKDALDFALEYMSDGPNDDQDFDLINSIRILRAMLEEAKT